MGNLPSKENKGKFVCEIFDAIAGRYDLMNSMLTLGLDRPGGRFLAGRSALKAGGHGLDVCCGTGMLTMELARLAGPAGKVIGLDFSQNMLAAAQEKIKHFALKNNIHLMQGNALELPFADNTFDCVTIGWGLRNLPDIITAVAEMTRVVKPGGKVLSLDMGQPDFPVFKQLYWLCFKQFVPALGKLWTRNKEAYYYLYQSARVFPHQAELARIFAQAGLAETTYHNLAWGVVAVVEGQKPAILRSAKPH